jgi:hypothetical protein
MPIQPVGFSGPVWDVQSISASPSDSTQQARALTTADLQKDTPLALLTSQVLSMCMQEEQTATVILHDALVAEQQWRKVLMERLEQEQAQQYTNEKRHSLIRTGVDLIMPLSLVASGIVALTAGAGIPVLAGGAVAVGALLALDTLSDVVFGGSAKKALASTLARGDVEDTQSWCNRISIVTGVVVFALGMGISGNQAVVLATNVARFTAESAEAGSAIVLDRQKARLLEHDYQWETSGLHVKQMLGDIESMVSSVNDIFLKMSTLQESTTRTTTEIFQRV